MIKIDEIELNDTEKECLARLDSMKDEDIDCSDIPEVTDWTGWMRARDGRPVIASKEARVG